MAELVWTAQSPLQKVVNAGKSGIAGLRPGVCLEEMGTISLLLVMARRGKWQAVVRVAADRFGVAPPTRPSAVSSGETTLIWAGPDQFYVLEHGEGPHCDGVAVHQAFAGKASISDQSCGRVMIRISGTKARAALTKVCSLDLDDSVFGAGAAAVTSVDHTSVVLWRAPDEVGEPRFNLLVFSSFAESLWHTLNGAAMEFGLRVAASSDEADA